MVVTYIISCSHTLQAAEGSMQCHTASKEPCITPLPAHKNVKLSFFVIGGSRNFKTEIGPRGGEQGRQQQSARKLFAR